MESSSSSSLIVPQPDVFILKVSQTTLYTPLLLMTTHISPPPIRYVTATFPQLGNYFPPDDYLFTVFTIHLAITYN
jgi:hypothetical protein